MADLDHNVNFGPVPGPDVPALDTHPKIFSFKEMRLVLGSELLAAQGVDMFESLAGKRCSLDVLFHEPCSAHRAARAIRFSS